MLLVLVAQQPPPRCSYAPHHSLWRLLVLLVAQTAWPNMFYVMAIHHKRHITLPATGRHTPPLVLAARHGADRNYLAMSKSTFCLAPSGFGWGIRLAEAMHSGCVPVIVQDHIYAVRAYVHYLGWPRGGRRYMCCTKRGVVVVAAGSTCCECQHLTYVVRAWARPPGAAGAGSACTILGRVAIAAGQACGAAPHY